MYVGISCWFVNAIKNCIFLLWFWAFFWIQEIRHKREALSSCSTAISSYTCAFFLEKTVLWAGCSVFSGSWWWKLHGWNEKVLERMFKSRKGVWQRPPSKEAALQEEKLFHYYVLSWGLRLAWGSEVPLKGVAFRSMFSSDLNCLRCLKVSVVKTFLF